MLGIFLRIQTMNMTSLFAHMSALNEKLKLMGSAMNSFFENITGH